MFLATDKNVGLCLNMHSLQTFCTALASKGLCTNLNPSNNETFFTGLETGWKPVLICNKPLLKFKSWLEYGAFGN